VALENVQVYSELEQRVQARTLELECANAQLREEIKNAKRQKQRFSNYPSPMNYSGFQMNKPQ